MCSELESRCTWQYDAQQTEDENGVNCEEISLVVFITLFDMSISGPSGESLLCIGSALQRAHSARGN